MDRYLGGRGAAACFSRGLLETSRKAKEMFNKSCFLGCMAASETIILVILQIYKNNQIGKYQIKICII